MTEIFWMISGQQRAETQEIMQHISAGWRFNTWCLQFDDFLFSNETEPCKCQAPEGGGGLNLEQVEDYQQQFLAISEIRTGSSVLKLWDTGGSETSKNSGMSEKI